MNEYHKIQTLWERESEKPCNIIPGLYATPEFEFLKQAEWVGTEKVDGTNIRVIFDPAPKDAYGKEVAFAGKTNRAQLPPKLYEHLHETFTYERLSLTFGLGRSGPVTLYGEGFGAGIQRGGENYFPEGNSFVLFDILIDDLWLERKNVNDIAQTLQIPHVPTVAFGNLSELSSYVAAGFQSTWGPFEAEGLVLRPRVELQDRRGKRIISKLKTKDFRKLNRRGDGVEMREDPDE